MVGLAGWLILGVFMFVLASTTWALHSVNPAETVIKNSGSPHLMMAEITIVDKLFFLKEKEKKDTKRMTWEGVLASDSPEAKACKEKCLVGYGSSKANHKGKLCDDKGWDRCMQLMDWGFLHWHRECKGEHKVECDACWQRQTQACYDGAFKTCLDRCP